MRHDYGMCGREYAMRILVIDDTKKHLDAALQTLVGHDVTIFNNYDKAVELLEEDYDGETQLPYWDAVLCDLLMPAGKDCQGRNGLQYVGQEMPVDWSLAIVAATRGARYVAVVTDLDHHSHPASAMIDRIPRRIKVDGSIVMFTNSVARVGIVGSECDCPTCNGTMKHRLSYDGSENNCSCKTGKSFSKWGKNWGGILENLLE